MTITTAKIKGDNYLVNGDTLVPNDIDNAYYKDLKEWEANGGIIEPEFTYDEVIQNEINKTILKKYFDNWSFCHSFYIFICEFK